MAASDEQKEAAYNKVANQERWDALEPDMRTAATSEGYTPDTLNAKTVELLREKLNNEQIQQAAKQAAATATASSRATAQVASEEKNKQLITDPVFDPWKAQFTEITGKPPTYKDLLDAGINIPTAPQAKELVDQRKAISEMVVKGEKLSETIQEFGVKGRGAGSNLATFIVNSASTIKGFYQIFGAGTKSATARELNQTYKELEQGGYFQGIKEAAGANVQTKRQITQVAYALAKTFGQKGRSVTQAILEQQFLPLAGKGLNNPQIAYDELRDLMQVELDAFNVAQRTLLGENFPDFELPILPKVFDLGETPDPLTEAQQAAQALDSIAEDLRLAQ